jgi:hypothetical protein
VYAKFSKLLPTVRWARIPPSLAESYCEARTMVNPSRKVSYWAKIVVSALLEGGS